MSHLISNSSGRAWSATEGTIAALRLADDIPGAGQGFSLLEFTVPVSRGVRGRSLVGSQGVRLGIIAKGMARGPGGAFTEAGPAVPLGTMIGLANGSGNQAPGSGTVLQTAAIRLAR